MPTFDLEEAVARFFPRGTDYDHKQAKHLIAWLNRCGYTIVRKEETEQPQIRQPKTKA